VNSKRTGLDRWLTVPNLLSSSRILLVALYLYLLFGRDDRILATYVLAIAGTTDFLDGAIARRFDQVTSLGIALDPTADRILLAAAITSMISYGAIPLWIAVIVIAREFAVAVAVIYLEHQHEPRLEVTLTGKAAAFGLMVGFPLLLLGHGPGGWTHPLTIATEIALIPALGLSCISGISYLRPAHRIFLERRAR